jgi:peroxiredoxin
MKTLTLVTAAAIMSVAAASVTIQASKVGEPAPMFKGTDTRGKVHTLSDFKGKWVVLEWHNNGCPYVRKHYESGHMQKLQQEWTSKGVVWLTVISSAPGTQGYVTAADADAYAAKMKVASTATLLDPTGELGHMYDAKVTPHMYVINPDGVLVYNGAIDDKPTSDQSDLATAKNYVSEALTEAMAGKAVSTPTSRPYGCGIKYAR